MDNTEKKIAEGLRQIAKKYGGGGICQGATVKTIDDTTFTCSVETDDEYEMPGILYKSISGGEIDVVFQPSINSRVFILQIDDSDEWMIVKFGAIDKVKIKIGETTFNMDGNLIELNGGQLGGMVKVEGLVSKLNAIESDLNSLKTVFNSWIVAPLDGGAALKTAATTWSTQNITVTERNELENIKVKQ